MKHALQTIICMVAAFSAALPAMAADYDLIILNGRVMDPETMLDDVMNVGIKDGRIAVITKERITGKQRINARGLVVAPGFIDTHFHAMDGLGMKMAARDGLTSVLSLEGGAWNIDAWYKSKEGKWPLNFGAAASHERAREIVLDGLKFDGPVDSITVFDDRTKAGEDGVPGWSVTRPTIEQLNELSKLVDEQLRQGALGICSLTGYAREGTTTYELFEMQRAAARYGRLFSSHQRFHGNPKNPQSALGFDEMFTNAALLDAPLMVCHNNDYDWWEIEEKLHLARSKGMNMWSEYYPYAAASSEINAEYMKPEIFEGLMGYKYEESVYDPSQDKFLTKEEVLKMQKEDPGHTIVIHLKPRQRWMPYWLKMPHMTVASDAMWMDGGRDASFPAEQYTGHPRSAGSRGKVLKMAREAGVPLMFTLHQLSYWSAKHLGDMGLKAMQERGRLQQGMVADITIFDAAKVQDHATFKIGEQGLPTSGIPYVIVSGTLVVKDSKFQYDTFPGQPIRFPMEDEGRFEPLTVNKWVKDFSISTPEHDLHVSDEANEESQKRYERLGSGE